ncbi:MAG TPA: iron-sulfur cluster assembly scaffold protein [Pyrinomonadaceae bacterium]|nr:iron-sulfur cluster assembly scaffold protein [Pyrinomonadaceae bacterium]
MAYSLTLKDHIANPRNAGELADGNAIGEGTNPVCGDRLKLFLRIADGRVTATRFLAYGCPPTIACGSALTELINGKSVDELRTISRKDLVDAVGGLPARKQHAAALAIETLQRAIALSFG